MVYILCVLSIPYQAYKWKLLLLWGEIKVLKALKVWGKPVCLHKQGKIHMAFCWLGKTRSKMPSTWNFWFRKWERPSHGKKKKNQDKRKIGLFYKSKRGRGQKEVLITEFQKKTSMGEQSHGSLLFPYWSLSRVGLLWMKNFVGTKGCQLDFGW